MRDRNRKLRLVPPLHRATHRVGLFLNTACPGLSQGEAHVLAHLAAADACPIRELQRGFAHKRSTLTSILDRLEAAGLVRRELRSDDRRSFRIALTPRGRSLARRVQAQLLELERRVAGRVAAADVAGFEAVVEAIQAAAEE